MSKYRLIGTIPGIDADALPPEWYDHFYEVSTKGGNGNVWEVSDKSYIYTTISTNDVFTKEIHPNGKRVEIPYKRHYVLNQLGLDNIMSRLIEQRLKDMGGKKHESTRDYQL